MLSLRRFISIAAFLAASLSMNPIANAANPPVTIPAFTKDYHPRDHRSPDGMYLARLGMGEGEAGVLTIWRVHRGGPSSLILRRVWDVCGALWLPSRPHALAFGASSTYGPPMLALWNGGQLHQLVRVKDPEGELFELWGLAADGHTLLYSRGEDSSKGIVWRRYHVRVPRRFWQSENQGKRSMAASATARR
ncbi:MAG: hypothetical protein M3Y56_01840 [Armatimonadota bacterium]|nr:hypothetical protein [Armatimonadota bacterium]